MKLEKITRKSLITGTLILLIMGFWGCEFYQIRKSDNIPMLLLSDTIYHPPDTFKMAFPMQSNNYARTGIVFDTTSMWLIKKLNSQTTQLNILNGESDSLLYKVSGPVSEIRFIGDIYYYISAHSSHQGNKNMVVYFEKLIQ